MGRGGRLGAVGGALAVAPRRQLPQATNQVPGSAQPAGVHTGPAHTGVPATRTETPARHAQLQTGEMTMAFWFI